MEIWRFFFAATYGPTNGPPLAADAGRADRRGALVGHGSRQVEAPVAGLGARPDVGGRPAQPADDDAVGGARIDGPQERGGRGDLGRRGRRPGHGHGAAAGASVRMPSPGAPRNVSAPWFEDGSSWSDSFVFETPMTPRSPAG